MEARRDEIAEIVRRHKGRSVSLFGSAARDEDTDSNDVDFLVEFDHDSSLLDLLLLQDELADLLWCSVDVVSTRGLKPRDAHILAAAVRL